MLPVAQLVFLSPRAALVGLVFLVPLFSVVVRERTYARARETLGLQRPRLARMLLRPVGLVVLAGLVVAAAAQPVIRDTGTTAMRSDAELLLTFDVSRSMLAASRPGGVGRLERARALGMGVHEALRNVPTGVATLTNRMMPLLFPTADERGVAAVIEHSLRIMQPRPAPLTAARASSLAALGLAADRSYFNPSARKRVLVVFGDLDSDFFSLDGTLRLLRKHRIEPFVVRVAARGERIFAPDGRPYGYSSVSTVTVAALRRANWHAFEEGERGRLVAELRSTLGRGPVSGSGIVESQRELAPLFAIAALAVASVLLLPALGAGLLARA